MIFEENGISGKVVQFTLLEHIMHKFNIIRAGQWDYERVTYDYKFENMDTGDVYYLRIPCIAIEGEVESPYSMIKILDPLLGKHYYPHGVEYRDEEFPKNILDKCKNILNHVQEEIEKHEE
jgi:hypothetical protein